MGHCAVAVVAVVLDRGLLYQVDDGCVMMMMIAVVVALTTWIDRMRRMGDSDFRSSLRLG